MIIQLEKCLMNLRKSVDNQIILIWSIIYKTGKLADE